MNEKPFYLAENFSGPFPDARLALTEPDGLLAVGGNLKPETILQAYRQGIFPWYSDDYPILWWSPNPRCVLFPEKLKISRSLKKTLNKKIYEVRTDTAFREVMQACAAPRKAEAGTWINNNMLNAYCRLHELGYAHSIECWRDGKLVGGLYGIKIGEMFFGESMFSKKTDASKVALEYLCNTIRPKLIDSQVYTGHMESMGAELIDRDRFIELVNSYSKIILAEND
ncbi:MAG: leucyl/phenylalanyl-tRNA--protein transferase [Gammaproteobacteria bacterium]|nr:leucyl/phenylalanyl-tRNA--protein transferase [Gammaproteobacteria bacterium]